MTRYDDLLAGDPARDDLPMLVYEYDHPLVGRCELRWVEFGELAPEALIGTWHQN